MAVSEYKVEIGTGRRSTDGRVRISVFATDLLAITLEGHGERAPTLLMTAEQARKLEGALAELIPLIEQNGREKDAATGDVWQGGERRTTGELK